MRRWNRKLASRGGFSMLEITLVLAIIGILIAVTSAALLPQMLGARKKTTKATMRNVADQLTAYNLNTGSYPNNLDVLVGQYLQKNPMDAWNRPLYYQPPVTAGGEFTLLSMGEDGQPLTDDDIEYFRDVLEDG